MTPAEIEPLLVSLRAAAWGAVVALPLALPVGWALARRVPGRLVIEAAMLALLVMPPTTVGYALLRLGAPHTPVGTFLGERLGPLPALLPLLATAVVSLPFLAYGARVAFRASRLTAALAGSLGGLALALARGVGEIGTTLAFGDAGLAGSRTLPMAIHVALQAPDGGAAATRLAVVSAGIALACAAVAALLWRLDRARTSVPPPAVAAPIVDAPASCALAGTLREQHLVDGLSRIETGHGALWVPRVPLTVGSPVIVRIAANDIVLAAPPPPAAGVLGALEVRVRSVTPLDATFVDVAIDIGQPPEQGELTVRTTSRVQRLLGLEPGRPVTALVRSCTTEPPA